MSKKERGQPQVTLAQRYDYIVCGSGSSGSAVAGRLAANPAVSVLLIEAGGTDDTPNVLDPNRWMMAFGSDLEWGFMTEPNPRLNGRVIPYTMGKVLGGGSSINVSTWSRGHRSDWDSYARATGEKAWSYESVLEVYRRIEDYQGPPDAHFRGVGGPVYVRPAPNPHPFFRALIDGSASTGIAPFDNPNSRMMESEGGTAVADEIVHGDVRQSIFRSYVEPLRGRPNLTILTGTLVTRVVLDGHKARGVEIVHDGETRRVEAGLEVILSLGAIQTPRVLMQSGIGDASALSQLGIPLVQPLSAVGRNLHDHVALGQVWEGTGADMPTEPRGRAVSFWKTRAELEAPNAFTYTFPAPFVTPENAKGSQLPPGSWSFAFGMRPRSRGSVTLTGPNAADPLKIDAGDLDDPQDMQDILLGLARLREIGNSAAMSRFTKGELLPGNASRAELERFVRDGLVTFWHQSGTARMGRDETSVVDGHLKVHGVEGLRVADASVLPSVTVGNTMAPSVVIGEQAAAFIREAHGA
jgi:choline dehydrogenase